MDNVRFLPGSGVLPGPGPRVADLDAIDDRYTMLLEVRETSPASVIALAAGACADDVPVLVAEVHRVEVLRQQLAAEVDRLTALVDAVRALHTAQTVTTDCAPDCCAGCHEVTVCAECGYEVETGPCATVAALDGGGSDG